MILDDKEIRIEQIVVTGTECLRLDLQSLLSRLHASDQPIKIPGKVYLVLAGNPRIFVYDTKNIKGAGNIGHAMDLSQYIHHLTDGFGLAHLFRWNWTPGDKAGYQIPFRPDKVKYFRSNTQPTSSQIGRIFIFSIDPQKFSVCPGDAKNKRFSAYIDAKIAVGDASAQRSGFQIASANPLRDTGKRLIQGQCHNGCPPGTLFRIIYFFQADPGLAISATISNDEIMPSGKASGSSLSMTTSR